MRTCMPYRGDNQELRLALSVDCLTALCSTDDRMLAVCTSIGTCRKGMMRVWQQ